MVYKHKTTALKNQYWRFIYTPILYHPRQCLWKDKQQTHCVSRKIDFVFCSLHFYALILKLWIDERQNKGCQNKKLYCPRPNKTSAGTGPSTLYPLTGRCVTCLKSKTNSRRPQLEKIVPGIMPWLQLVWVYLLKNVRIKETSI